MSPSPLDDFDPNKQSAMWASYCPGRYSSSFKLHLRRQDMTAAMNRHKRNGAIGYEHRDGKWVEIVRMEPCRPYKDDQPWLPERCERCFVRTTDPHPTRPHEIQVQHGKYVFVRIGGKLAEPLAVEFLCEQCRA